MQQAVQCYTQQHAGVDFLFFFGVCVCVGGKLEREDFLTGLFCVLPRVEHAPQGHLEKKCVEGGLRPRMHAEPRVLSRGTRTNPHPLAAFAAY